MADEPGQAQDDFESKTVEELDALLRQSVEDEPVAAEVNPEPETPEPTPEETPKADAGSDSTPEPEIDPLSLMDERISAERAKFEAQLQMQMAHNSRLAGEIGFLRQKLEAKASEPYTPETQADEDRLAKLQHKLDEMERAQRHEAANRAVAEASVEFQPHFKDAKPEEIQTVVAKYADQWKAALDSGDPEVARALSRAVFANVAADLRRDALERKLTEAREKKAASVARVSEAKKAATISGAGSAPPPKPQPKSYDDMTVEELDRELKRLYGSR